MALYFLLGNLSVNHISHCLGREPSLLILNFTIADIKGEYKLLVIKKLYFVYIHHFITYKHYLIHST